MKPVTPGEILLEEYLIPFGISQNALGRALGVSPRTINEIVLGRRSITPEMSMKLGRFFGQTSEFWFRVQSNCDFRDLRKRERTLTAKKYVHWPCSKRPEPPELGSRSRSFLHRICPTRTSGPGWVRHSC